MTADAHQLPAGIKVPKRYAQTIRNRRQFIAGVQDALAGWPLPEQEDFARQQGTAAWVAYALGYNAGLNWKARQGWELARLRRKTERGPASALAESNRALG